jgi:hypothetical protein
MVMEKIDILFAVEEIKKLRARYFRGADMKDWVLMKSVFAPDVAVDIRGVTTDPRTGINFVPSVGEDEIVGSDNVVEMIKSGMTGVTSVHRGYMPEIEILSERFARGIWAMEDILKWSEGAIIESMHGFGHYHENYENIDGEWKIKKIKLTRLMLDAKFRNK